MLKPISIPVRLGARSYPILIGKKIATHSLAQNPIFTTPSTKVFLIADTKLKSVAQTIRKQLGAKCVSVFFLRGGETVKNISTLPPLYTAAAQAQLDRHSIVIALGGGVIGDVVGFFAATYLRGLRLIQIPTTLVAQVDSSIGGKTGVNLPVGKNLVGAFHQPSLVIVDPTLLKTLPDREFYSGLAEVIKYGIIADTQLFTRLEKNLAKVLARDSKELTWIIQRCCSIKAKVVSCDEREITGQRAILNFGHTIGHGIEAALHYRLLHGEAVALGMIAATHLSAQMASLSSSSAQRICNLIQRTKLPTSLKSHSFKSDEILSAMRLDKKVVAGQFHFILIPKIGSACRNRIVSSKAVHDLLSKISS